MNVASAAMVLGLLIPSAAETTRPKAAVTGDDGLAGASLASLLVSIIDYCAPQGCVQFPAEIAGG